LLSRGDIRVDIDTGLPFAVGFSSLLSNVPGTVLRFEVIEAPVTVVADDELKAPSNMHTLRHVVEGHHDWALVLWKQSANAPMRLVLSLAAARLMTTAASHRRQ
jgi:hypothetical protein